VRILYLSYGAQSGVVASLAGALRARGADVTVVDAAEGLSYRMGRLKLPSPRPANVRNVLAARRQFSGDWKHFFLCTDLAFGRMSRAAERAVERERPGAVIQAGVLFAPPRAPVPRLLYIDHTYAISKRYTKVDGLPDAGRMSGDYEAAERAAYHAADAVLTMSDFVRRSVIDDYGVDPGRVHVIGAGPNLDPLPGEPAGPPGWPPTVLFVGKDFARKGGPALLEAFRAARGDVPEARLVIVGPPAGGPLPGVTWAGRLGHGEMPALYAAASASAFALPTLREPFGLVFLEAMAFGLPCVGTNVEAVPEIIEDGVTGYVVPPGDAAALSVALRSLLRDREAASRMGRAGWEQGHRIKMGVFHKIGKSRHSD